MCQAYAKSNRTQQTHSQPHEKELVNDLNEDVQTANGKAILEKALEILGAEGLMGMSPPAYPEY